MLLSFKNTAVALQNRETTCLAIVQHAIQVAKEKEHLNVFREVFEEQAMARANQIDEKIQNGKAGRLAGMIVGLKDVICCAGYGVGASSQILEGYISPFSATVVERLEAEDAIIIGRQNCDEFAMGSSNENSAFRATLNPIDPTRVPGGSSGASACSVASGMCHVALGSDTGGSVRQPASFCGVVGTKPTYSRISRHGLLAYASSFDTIGIMSRNVADSALVLEIIAGADAFDASVSTKPVELFSNKLTVGTSKRIGFIQETIEHPGLSKEIKTNFKETIEKLRNMGHELVPVEYPLLDYILPTYYILTTAEASTNLARYDGVRYGYRSGQAFDTESLLKNSRSEGFGPEVRRRIMLGTFVLSASYYDAYFTKAQKVRRLIRDTTENLLDDFDYLISPTTPSTAFELGKYDEGNMLEMYLADLFTVQASVSGIPAISIPCGKDSDGLPMGLQIMGKAFDEAGIFSLAHQFEEQQ